MTAAAEQTETILGRYEVSAQQFTDTLKDEPRENILQFDLKAAFPDVLAQSARLPKIAEKLWRRVLDDNVAEFGGAYCPVKGSTFVQVWFENLPSGAAKAKLPGVAERMKSIFGKVRDDKENPDATLETFFPKPKEKDARQAPQLSPELARLMQQGLQPNPTVEMLDLWMSRTMQNMMHAQEKTAFTKDILEVLARADISFLPVWTPANELLVGTYAAARNVVPGPQQTAAEPMRIDLLGAFMTCMQLAMLANKKMQALGFISFRQPTILNKNVMDLLAAFFLRVPPEVKKNLIFEIRGIPKGTLAPSLKKALELLVPHAKAVIVDTGIFAKEDYSKDIPKLHAYGFDLAGMSLPEVEIVSLLRKYAENYKGRPQKMYVKGIQTPYIIKVAKECGYIYLSGPAVHPAEKLCTGIRQFPIKLG